MKFPVSARLNSARYAGLLIGAIVLSVSAIFLVSYRAVTEWRRSAAALAQRRGEATVDLLVTALVQDMRSVQATVLSDQHPDVMADTSADQYNLIASAFARYPYPEAFFTWNARPAGAPLFYTRSNRTPSWLAVPHTPNRFTVETTSDAEVGARLLTRITADARTGRRYSAFDVALGECRCQVVSLLSYDNAYRQRLKGVFGFIVDLGWVRDHYFAELAKQVTRIGADSGGLQLTLADGAGVAVFGAPASGLGVVGHRRFPLLFFDRRLVAVDWPDDLNHESWSAYATIAGDPAVVAANQGARRILAIAALMAMFAVLALWLIVHTARARAQLAEIRSEFISTVTHELKTPLASIQAIGQTLVSGRSVTPELSRKFGRFTVLEAKRLRRLIDNLLAYSRITDVADVYSFEPVQPDVLVEQTLRDFASQLEFGEFEVQVEVPPTIPSVRADRKAMVLVLSNLVDNAIRYSDGHKHLGVSVRNGGGRVVLSVQDHGAGIPAEEIPLVTRKFFTGQRADKGGSGLGLAIVERIVADHGGSLAIDSRVGEGTTVSIELPIASGQPS
jgi:signal transduction histidine kinase